MSPQVANMGWDMDSQIWNGILESERHYRYYHSLTEKFRKRQVWFDIVLLVCTGGICAVLAGHFLQGINEALAITLLTAVVAGIVVWQHSQVYKVKSVAANLIAIQYKVLSADWRRQWHLGSNNDDEVIIATLTERLVSIAAQYDLDFDNKLSREAEESADVVVQGEFKAAT